MAFRAYAARRGFDLPVPGNRGRAQRPDRKRGARTMRPRGICRRPSAERKRAQGGRDEDSDIVGARGKNPGSRGNIGRGEGGPPRRPQGREAARGNGGGAAEFHDDESTTVAANIGTIVGWHNAQAHDVDVSVHFNAAEGRTPNPIGTEVVVHPSAPQPVRALAPRVAQAIAPASGFRLRRPGAHPGVKELNAGFVQECRQSPILLEVCFVNSGADSGLYNDNFDEICIAIAEALAGESPADLGAPGRWRNGLAEIGGCIMQAAGKEVMTQAEIDILVGTIQEEGSGSKAAPSRELKERAAANCADWRWP